MNHVRVGNKTYSRKELAQRRKIARANYSPRVKSYKMFNMDWVNDSIDAIIGELGEYASREPEIGAAVQVLVAAKRLVSAYSERSLNSPYKAGFTSVEQEEYALTNTLLQLVNSFWQEWNKTATDNNELMRSIIKNAIDWANAESINPQILEGVNEVVQSFQESTEVLLAFRQDLTNDVKDLAKLAGV